MNGYTSLAVKVGCAMVLVFCNRPVIGTDLSFSDPHQLAPPRHDTIGFPSRGPDVDVAPGFRDPTPGYGIVPFYWWLGDPLTKERLAWQLEQMNGMGVSGYQINYAHSDRGGRSWGLTYPSEPALFSPAWWELVGWCLGEAQKQGAGISLSDDTVGFGQGWCVDTILREHPEVTGLRLRMDRDGRVQPETVPWSLNAMHPQSGRLYAEAFFGPFDRRFPGEGGKGISNLKFHYLGSAKILDGIGKGLAEALAALKQLKQPEKAN